MIEKPLGNTSVKVSAVGQGTGIGGYSGRPYDQREQVKIIAQGVREGLSFIDTAPVYENGAAEEAVGAAVQGLREDVFIATKLPPEDVTADRVLQAAEASLQRLRTDRIDLYQIHWSNPNVPIDETLAAIVKLVEMGKVRFIGVSNFSLRELEAARAAVPGGQLVSLQSDYNLFDRSVEDHLLPFCNREKITMIAYSPLHRGRVASCSRHEETLKGIAENHGKTMAQVVLRWLISHERVVVIPNTMRPERVHENAGSMTFNLTPEEVARIDEVCKVPTEMVPTDAIHVSTETGRAVYETVEEAMENKLNFVPSPAQLAEQVRAGDFLKPVRLTLAKEPGSGYEYELLEGRIRYWAWVIAHGGKEPIPALIEER